MEKIKRMVSILLLIFMLLPVALAFAEEPKATAAQEAPAPAPVLKSDPSGANSGGASDVVGASANAPTADDCEKFRTKRTVSYETGRCGRA